MEQKWRLLGVLKIELPPGQRTGRYLIDLIRPVNHRRVNAAHTFSDSCLVPLPRQLLVALLGHFLFAHLSFTEFHPGLFLHPLTLSFYLSLFLSRRLFLPSLSRKILRPRTRPVSRRQTGYDCVRNLSGALSRRERVTGFLFFFCLFLILSAVHRHRKRNTRHGDLVLPHI